MPILHVVLFRLKPGLGVESMNQFKTACKAMVGQVPGLIKMDVGPPLESTAHRAKGYNMGVVAQLEKAEDVKVYAEHESHKKVLKLRDEICEADAIAFDVVT